MKLSVALADSGLAASPPDSPPGGDAELDTIAVQVEAPPAIEPRAADVPAELDAVIVTARRHEERALDVPLSMVVVDGESLAAAGLVRPQDIQQRTPGLTVTVPSPRLTQYTLRGLGSTSQNDGMESSVGLFLDGVYLGRQGLSVFDLIDLERVEVLRGPQGTLYGRNTTAGAVNLVTRAPVFGRETRFDAMLGDDGLRQWRGSLNDTLVDGRLAGRLSAYLSDKDGTIDNRYGGDPLNGQHRRGLRGQLLWEPDDALRGRLIAEHGWQDERCCVYPLIVYRDTVRARDEYMEYTRVPRDFRARETDSDTATHSRVEQTALTLAVDAPLGESLDVTSISAWRDWTADPTSDDATSLQLVPETGVRNRQRQLSQEVRFNFSTERLHAVLGLYYLDEQLQGYEHNRFGDDLVGWTFGGLIREQVPLATESNTGLLLYALIPPATLDGMQVQTWSRQHSRSAAAFGSIDWHLSERVDLTTGLRYTYGWKHASVDRERSGGCPDCSVLSLTNTVSDLLDQLLGVDIGSVSASGLLDGIVGGEYARRTSREEGDWSGQLALRYQPQHRISLYAALARGYKAGGINLGAVGESVRPTFKPETATALEAGIKGRGYGGRLNASLALHHTRVRDYQALTFDNEVMLIPNPRQVNLLNVGDVRVQGIEAELEGIPAPGLHLRAGVAYNRAISVDFPNAPDESSRRNDKDLSGETLYNAPRWIVSTGADYGVPLAQGREVYAAVDGYYRSGAWATVEHGAGSYIDGYALVDLRLGWRAQSRRWDVSLFARNLLDRDYLASVYALYGVGDYGGTAGDARSIGMLLRLYLD